MMKSRKKKVAKREREKRKRDKKRKTGSGYEFELQIKMKERCFCIFFSFSLFLIFTLFLIRSLTVLSFVEFRRRTRFRVKEKKLLTKVEKMLKHFKQFSFLQLLLFSFFASISDLLLFESLLLLSQTLIQLQLHDTHSLLNFTIVLSLSCLSFLLLNCLLHKLTDCLVSSTVCL